jgi:hypothetical protein
VRFTATPLAVEIGCAPPPRTRTTTIRTDPERQ